MQHKWNMYANQGERRIPELIETGEIDLPCSNPDADSYRQQYDPAPLWLYLQNESDLSTQGLYLSLYCIARPTYDGKQWFVRTAYNSSEPRMRQEATREVSWVNVKGIHFWNTSFRDHARIHQSRGIVDYTLYVSRAFGYCFLLGLRYDGDDEDERIEFTNFYPSVHHYHEQVAINEIETYQPFNDSYNWFPRVYGQESDTEEAAIEGADEDSGEGVMPTLAQAADRITDTMRNWVDVVEGVDLGELLLDNDSDEEEED